jgi:hypothetical protein
MRERLADSLQLTKMRRALKPSQLALLFDHDLGQPIQKPNFFLFK